MAKPGRKPLAMPTKSRICYIPEDLSAEIDMLLADPLKQKVMYGSFSALVSTLLRQWVDERRKEINSDNANHLGGGSGTEATAKARDDLGAGSGVTTGRFSGVAPNPSGGSSDTK